MGSAGDASSEGKRWKAALFTILICSCAPVCAQDSSSLTAAAGRLDVPNIDCAWYGRDVALDGILLKQTAVRPEKGAASYYLLEPQAPLCVNGDQPSLAEQGLDSVKAVQIAASVKDFERLSTLIGRPVTVRGRLFGGTTAHHFEPVLIDPETIEPQSAATIAFQDFWSDFRTAVTLQDCAAMADMAAIPFESLGSLDSDAVHQLDREAVAEQCPSWLQGHALMREGSASGAFTTAGALPPTNWRSAPLTDEYARFDAFEFVYEQGKWQWQRYYRQNQSDVRLD